MEDFSALCSALIEEIHANNFIRKSLIDRSKMQTSSPNAYRALVYFLKTEKA